MSHESRIEASVERIPESGCWVYTGNNLNSVGYARFKIGGRKISGHRLSYETYVGPIGDLFVLHRCDVPCCLNPAHLMLGTQADNMQDKFRKRRHSDRRAEGCPTSKINWDIVRSIRTSLARGEQQKDLAARFAISQPTVSDIARNKTWVEENG